MRLKIRFNQKNATKIIISITLLSLVFYVLFEYQLKIGYSASYIFTQTDWSGGATTTTAVHPTNQTGWNSFSTATNIDFSKANQLTLQTTSYSIPGIIPKKVKGRYNT